MSRRPFSQERICKICGKSFIAKHNRRMVCYDDHYRTCMICNKPFVCNSMNSNIKTCSEACRRKSISRNSSSSVKRYLRTCKVCGKAYYSSIKDESKDFGMCDNVHSKTCVVCGKSFDVEDKYLYDSRKTCSEECRYKLSGQTWHENIEEHLQHSKNILQSRYGVDYTWQIPGVSEKSKQTCLDRYGETSYSKTGEFKDRLVSGNRDKYGTDWYMQTSEYWEKTRATWQGRRRVTRFCQSNVEFVKQQMDLDMEQEMFDFLCEFISSEEIQRNTFQIITPYELDIYLPKYNFAIECNPTATHNSTFSMWGSVDKAILPSYHKVKTDLCSQKGIFLFHVFGYEWVHRKDIIKSMIRNALKCTSAKIYGRDTEIRKVDFAESIKFLELNHRQGKAISKIRLGLYYKDELVSLMTFGKMRNTIGTGSANLEDCYELARFCNKINTSVVGGASKLFKYFLKTYNPTRIRSFSDKAHTVGSLYQVLEFQYVHESDPGYVWVDKKTDIAYSRVNAQKQNIQSFLKDENIDLSKTEVSIMSEHGFVQVFDSGTILWEWRKADE